MYLKCQNLRGTHAWLKNPVRFLNIDFCVIPDKVRKETTGANITSPLKKRQLFPGRKEKKCPAFH
jgi:hypothetical protein